MQIQNQTIVGEGGGRNPPPPPPPFIEASIFLPEKNGIANMVYREVIKLAPIKLAGLIFLVVASDHDFPQLVENCSL